MPSGSYSGRHARHNKCLSTAACKDISEGHTAILCFHCSFLFSALRVLYILPHTENDSNVHLLSGLRDVNPVYNQVTDSQACALSDWHLTHINVHIHNSVLSPHVGGLTLPVISVQIKAPLAGWPELLAFINWSTFIQLLSSLSLFSTGAVKNPRHKHAKPQPVCPFKTCAQSSRLTELTLAD